MKFVEMGLNELQNIFFNTGVSIDLLQEAQKRQNALW